MAASLVVTYGDAIEVNLGMFQIDYFGGRRIGLSRQAAGSKTEQNEQENGFHAGSWGFANET